MSQLINLLMNDEGVCRTGLATPGLLIIFPKVSGKWEICLEDWTDVEQPDQLLAGSGCFWLATENLALRPL